MTDVNSVSSASVSKLTPMNFGQFASANFELNPKPTQMGFLQPKQILVFLLASPYGSCCGDGESGSSEASVWLSFVSRK